MLTDDLNQVDCGLWLSVSALAEQQGVSKQAISKNIKRWSEQGVEIATRRSGREILVSVAQYDRARGEHGTLSNQQSETTKREANLSDPVYTREKARTAAYEADLKQLDLQERLGKLIPIEQVEVAAATCAESILRIIRQTSTRSEELAGVLKIPISEARAFLKAMQDDLLRRSSEEFSKLAVNALRSTADKSQDDE